MESPATASIGVLLRERIGVDIVPSYVAPPRAGKEGLECSLRAPRAGRRDGTYARAAASRPSTIRRYPLPNRIRCTIPGQSW
jgi:hypothetical protein